jgi:hypothetical protein
MQEKQTKLHFKVSFSWEIKKNVVTLQRFYEKRSNNHTISTLSGSPTYGNQHAVCPKRKQSRRVISSS